MVFWDSNGYLHNPINKKCSVTLKNNKKNTLLVNSCSCVYNKIFCVALSYNVLNKNSGEWTLGDTGYQTWDRIVL